MGGKECHLPKLEIRCTKSGNQLSDTRMESTTASKTIYLRIAALVAIGGIGSRVSAQNLFSNPGFELGSAQTSSEPTFLGAIQDTFPVSGWGLSSWTVAAGSNAFPEQWVQNYAQAGTKSVYLSSSSNLDASNACLQYTGTLNLTIGGQYTISAYVANAGSRSGGAAGNGANGDPATGTLFSGSQPGTSANLVAGKFLFEVINGATLTSATTIPANSSWNNQSAANSVSWSLVSYTFTAQVANPTIYLTATSPDGTGNLWSNLLVDSPSLTAVVPESETWAAGAFAASAVVWTGWRRRRSPAKSAPKN